MLDFVTGALSEVDTASIAAVAAAAGTDEAKVAVPPGSWKEAPYTFLPKDNQHLQALLCVLSSSSPINKWY